MEVPIPSRLIVAVLLALPVMQFSFSNFLRTVVLQSLYLHISLLCVIFKGMFIVCLQGKKALKWDLGCLKDLKADKSLLTVT